MTGTKKQVAWAEDIRAAYEGHANALIDSMRAKAPVDFLQRVEGLRNDVLAIADAAWWIERREPLDSPVLVRDALAMAMEGKSSYLGIS